MLKLRDAVKVKHNNKIGAVVAIEQKDAATKYIVLIDSKKFNFYEEQI